MPDTPRNYTISTDFPGGAVNTTKLKAEILASSITTVLNRIDTAGDTVSIVFNAALTAGEATTLDNDVTGPAGGLIAAHDTVPQVSGVTERTVDPTVNDDASQGHVVGAVWVNTTTGRYFTLLDSTNGAAVWEEKVSGPTSATDNAVVRYNLATGKLLQNSGVTISDADEVRHAGTVEWDKGADLASATTLVLGSDGNSFDVTGTTNITAVSAKPIGTVILLQFDGVVELTHNTTSLSLEGEVAYKTEPGNTLGLHCYDGTNWREIFRQDNAKVRSSSLIEDQAMVRGNGGARRITATDNKIGEDNEIIMAGTIQFQRFTDAQLNDDSHDVNTSGGKVQGAQVYNSSQNVPVWAVGSANGSLWVDGVGATVNTPV